VDIADRQAVSDAINRTKPTRIFHLAGAPDVEASWTCAVPHLRINVLGTEHLLDAVRRSGHPCRVLVVTSAQVYDVSNEPIAEDARLLPQNPYGLTKLAQDQLACAAANGDGLDVMIARPFNHIGPGQGPSFAIASFARQIARIEQGLAPHVLRVGNLTARRDITDVRDVVEAYRGIVERGQRGRAYNVCSGVAHEIRQLLDRLLALSNARIAIEEDPERLRPVDVPMLVGDAARIHGEIGWAPHISIEQTLVDTLDAWRGRVASER
jgi:GDP-4-dehydro-6-deoxy-D-mannose reductase